MWIVVVSLLNLKYLSVAGCRNIDDWCLDRFVQFRDSLVVLDISRCPLVTERGLATLHKLQSVYFVVYLLLLFKSIYMSDEVFVWLSVWSEVQIVCPAEISQITTNDQVVHV